MIGDDIEIQILSITGNRVQIGISAPSDVNIVRKELEEKNEKDH